jgi:hypothetical protein
MAATIRGNSLYRPVSGPYWATSRNTAISLGGDLVSLNTKEEQNFVVNYLKTQTPANEDYFWWIGLLRDTSTEKLGWADGSDATFTDWYQDNEVQYPYITRTQDTDLDAEITTDPFNVRNNLIGSGLWAQGIHNQNIRNGIAEFALSLSVTQSSRPIEGGGTFTTSINLAAGTQTSGNLAEGAKVWWVISGITQDDLASGELSGSGNISSGKLDISHSLVKDQDQGERFEVSVYSQDPSTAAYEPQNLIGNGDFESDQVVETSPNWEVNYLIDWTPSKWSLIYGLGVDLCNSIRGDFSGSSPYGNYAELDGRVNNGISQTIATTKGESYNLSFDWAFGKDFTAPDPTNQLDVLINGTTVFKYDGSNGIGGQWNSELLAFIANSDQTVIEFRETGTSDSHGTLLDNVKLSLSHESYLETIKVGNNFSAEIIDTLPFQIGSSSSDNAKIVISGLKGSGNTASIDVETVTRTNTNTGSGKPVWQNVTTYTPLQTFTSVDGITYSGGSSANSITAAGVSGDPLRPTFNGQTIIDGQLGADTITGGSYRNWLRGGGIYSSPLSTTTTAVDSLIGTVGATDVFDLRTSDCSSDAYAALNTGSARITNYTVGEDWIVLAGAQGSYTITPQTTKSGKGKNTTTTTTGYQVFSGAELVATITASSGSSLTGNASTDLRILYGQTGSPSQIILGSEALFY